MSKKTKSPRKKKEKATDRRLVPHAKRGEPISGQSIKMDLEAADMSKTEAAIVGFLYFNRKEGPFSIADIQAGCPTFPKRDVSGGKLKIRNGIRRPVRGGWVKPLRGRSEAKRGLYEISTKGEEWTQAAVRAGLITKENSGTGYKKPAEVEPAKRSRETKPKREKKSSSKEKAKKARPRGYAGTVKSIAPQLDEAHQKAAVVYLAAREHGPSEAKVVKATGLSRSFVIPRIRVARDLLGTTGPFPMTGKVSKRAMVEAAETIHLLKSEKAKPKKKAKKVEAAPQEAQAQA